MTERDWRELRTALADAFDSDSRVADILGRIGFPNGRRPRNYHGSSEETWIQIFALLDNGIIELPQRSLLTAALEIYPYNNVFRTLADKYVLIAPRGGARFTEDVRLRPLRVLVIGASPTDLPPVRADQESRVISKAALPDRVVVSYAPAAESTDLDKVRLVRPHIVHFVCHGEGACLMFNDIVGESDPVPAVRVANTLRFYRESADISLCGIVLAACDGSTLAPAFADVADTVVGFDSVLSDPCGVAFARQFYTLLNDADDLAAAAREAAQLAAQFSSACGPLVDKLIICR
jgi:hypothetical protein